MASLAGNATPQEPLASICFQSRPCGLSNSMVSVSGSAGPICFAMETHGVMTSLKLRPVELRLECCRGLVDTRLVVVPTDEHHTYGKAVDLAAWSGKCRMPAAVEWRSVGELAGRSHQPDRR